MRFLIIGDGVAGHTAAVELREKNSEAEITIISDEKYPFYDRVALKRLVAGKAEYKELIKADRDFYRSKNIELELGTKVEEVKPDEKIVKARGEVYKYDKLLIAAGGHLRKLDLENSGSENVFYLWNMKDAESMGEFLKGEEKAVVIGGGFLGLEMAFSLKKRGLDIDYLIRESYWNENCLKEEAAEIVHSELNKAGVNIETDVEAEEFIAEDDLVGKVKADGKEYGCDLVVVCIGLIRNLEFLKGSGIETNRGVLTDKYLQTNYDDIYAAGDIAEFYNPIIKEKMLNGSWPSARRQGEVAAMNMLGKEIPFEFVNAHTISHFDLDIMTLGDIWLSEEKEVDFIGKGDSCVQILSRGDRIIGSVLINDLSAVPKIKKAVKQEKCVSEINKDQLI